MPGSGSRRERVRFERRATVGDDGYGNTTGGWRPLVGDRMVSLTVQKGGEQVQAARLQGVSAWVLVMDWDMKAAEVGPEDRAVCARTGRTWNIRWVGDLAGDNREITMHLEAGVADG
jgi:hypothetical protein